MTPCNYEAIVKEETPQATRLAKYIREVYAPKSFLDVGCGPGIYTHALLYEGLFGHGVDVDERVRGIQGLEVQDITSGVKPPQVEFVLSLEVGEHIPAEKSDAYVDYLTGAGARVILFSAARPGQGGDGYINCQEKSYWFQKIQARGYFYQHTASHAFVAWLKDGYHMGWLANNAMIFRK